MSTKNTGGQNSANLHQKIDNNNKKLKKEIEDINKVAKKRFDTLKQMIKRIVNNQPKLSPGSQLPIRKMNTEVIDG